MTLTPTERSQLIQLAEATRTRIAVKVTDRHLVQSVLRSLNSVRQRAQVRDFLTLFGSSPMADRTGGMKDQVKALSDALVGAERQVCLWLGDDRSQEGMVYMVAWMYRLMPAKGKP
jgi:hypothetical protein